MSWGVYVPRPGAPFYEVLAEAICCRFPYGIGYRKNKIIMAVGALHEDTPGAPALQTVWALGGPPALIETVNATVAQLFNAGDLVFPSNGEDDLPGFVSPVRRVEFPGALENLLADPFGSFVHGARAMYRREKPVTLRNGEAV